MQNTTLRPLCILPSFFKSSLKREWFCRFDIMEHNFSLFWYVYKYLNLSHYNDSLFSLTLFLCLKQYLIFYKVRVLSIYIDVVLTLSACTIWPGKIWNKNTLQSEFVSSHWGRLAHIYFNHDSYNGLSPGRRQAIILSKVGILLIRSIGKNFNDISIEIHTFWFR